MVTRPFGGVNGSDEIHGLADNKSHTVLQFDQVLQHALQTPSYIQLKKLYTKE
jgi:hypothetical protein